MFTANVFEVIDLTSNCLFRELFSCCFWELEVLWIGFVRDLLVLKFWNRKLWFSKRSFLTSKKCSNSDPKSRRFWTFSPTCPQLPTVKTRFTNQWHPSSTHKGKMEPTINEVTSFEVKLFAYLTSYLTSTNCNEN